MRPGQIGPRWVSRASRIAVALIAVVFGGGRDDVEEPAGPRIVMLPEDVGVRRDDAAEAVEKRRAAFEADERIVGRDLEAFGEILRRQGHQHIRIDPEGVLGPARKGAAHEHVEARHGQALGADIGFAGAAFLVAPLRARARIEQHGDDGEVEGGAGHVGRRFPWGAVHHRVPAVMAAGSEMAPAGMERDVERGIGLPDRRHDLVGAGLEPVEIDREMLETTVETGLQKLMRPLPHRGSGQEAQGRFRLGRQVRLVGHAGLRFSLLEMR